jgi:hypothetical protein
MDSDESILMEKFNSSQEENSHQIIDSKLSLYKSSNHSENKKIHFLTSKNEIQICDSKSKRFHKNFNIKKNSMQFQIEGKFRS